MKKRAIILAVLAGSVLASGCKSQGKQETMPVNTVEALEESSDADMTETIGMVKEISDSQITLVTGRPDRGGGRSGKNDAGNKRDGEDAGGGPNREGAGSGPEKDKENRPVRNQDEDEAGSKPGKEKEGRNSAAMTIMLSSATEVIDSEGQPVDIGEVKAGDMVCVEADAANLAVRITIKSSSGQIGKGASDSTDSEGRSGSAGHPRGVSHPGGESRPDGGGSEPDSYDAATQYTEDIQVSGEIYVSTGKDENGVLVQNGASVSMEDFTLTRTSLDSTGGDSSSFYGIGAGILVTDGLARIVNGAISTDSAGGAGVFSYGTGSVDISDTVITTRQDTSGGIHVAGGGTLHAGNLTVETRGESSAAIRSDRGGGTMTVDGGSYTSYGKGSPAIYCTADITVQNAELTAGGAEAICIEGLNSLKLTDCVLEGNMPEDQQNDCIWTVILYQSMSGDSEIGNSTFEMRGGSLISKRGGLFYTTNTESTFYLKDVDITPSASNAFFLRCTGNANQRGWGKTGSNGAQCTFRADSQNMEGDIIWDSISSLDFVMENGSTLKGAIMQEEAGIQSSGNNKDNKTIKSDSANLSIDTSSSWTVTGNSTLSSLTCKGTITGADGKTVSILGTDGTVYEEGNGAYTIITGAYKG